MLIAQITDLHIDSGGGESGAANLRRLRALISRLTDGPTRPNMLLMTGDLTDRGDQESYAALAEAVCHCPFPVWPMVGNHDTRAALLEAFPETPTHEGFVQYALEAGALRVLVLDTLEEGRHGGAFCDVRAQWLVSELATHPETPTFIVMHHPPAALGIDWLDPDEDEPWIGRFAAATAGHDQICGVTSGHLHRTIMSGWNGLPLMVCGSSAPAVALDLRQVDPDTPDNRVMITDEPPCYALHRWDGTRLASHFETVGGHQVIARYDAAMQPAVQDMMRERQDMF